MKADEALKRFSEAELAAREARDGIRFVFPYGSACITGARTLQIQTYVDGAAYLNRSEALKLAAWIQEMFG